MTRVRHTALLEFMPIFARLGARERGPQYRYQSRDVESTSLLEFLVPRRNRGLIKARRNSVKIFPMDCNLTVIFSRIPDSGILECFYFYFLSVL